MTRDWVQKRERDPIDREPKGRLGAALAEAPKALRTIKDHGLVSKTTYV